MPNADYGAPCTCSPYFGCSEYAPDCLRHNANARRITPPAHQSERTDTAEAYNVPFLLGKLQDAVNRAREDRAAQPSEPEREGER
jgi:hypothetical protein